MELCIFSMDLANNPISSFLFKSFARIVWVKSPSAVMLRSLEARTIGFDMPDAIT